jgi:hypothetical protein
MSNLETKLGHLRKAWAAKPIRSHWPAHLEPLPEVVELAQPPRVAGFFLNADDTPRFGAAVLAWPEPAAMVVRPSLPGFRDAANEDRTRAA